MKEAPKSIKVFSKDIQDQVHEILARGALRKLKDKQENEQKSKEEHK